MSLITLRGQTTRRVFVHTLFGLVASVPRPAASPLATRASASETCEPAGHPLPGRGMRLPLRPPPSACRSRTSRRASPSKTCRTTGNARNAGRQSCTGRSFRGQGSKGSHDDTKRTSRERGEPQRHRAIARWRRRCSGRKRQGCLDREIIACGAFAPVAPQAQVRISSVSLRSNYFSSCLGRRFFLLMRRAGCRIFRCTPTPTEKGSFGQHPAVGDGDRDGRWRLPRWTRRGEVEVRRSGSASGRRDPVVAAPWKAVARRGPAQRWPGLQRPRPGRRAPALRRAGRAGAGPAAAGPGPQARPARPQRSAATRRLSALPRFPYPWPGHGPRTVTRENEPCPADEAGPPLAVAVRR